MIMNYGLVEFMEQPTVFAKYQDPIDQLVKFPVGTLPPFVLLTDNTGAAASMLIVDAYGVAIGAAIPLSVSSNNDWVQLTYLGGAGLETECGNYRMQITHGSNTYYSEYFSWPESMDGLIKITAKPIGILVYNKYGVDLKNKTFTGYFSTAEIFNGRAYKVGGEVVEEGISKNYGNEILKTTINFENEFEIIGNDSTFKFLGMVTPSCVGGSVTVEFNNRSKYVHSMIVEQTENINFGERIIIKITARDVIFVSNYAV